jgi:anti-sigma regulatory factor (Ser/Thr protein kinase)
LERVQVAGFKHEALFYDGEASFLAGTVPLIENALARQEEVLVAVDDAKQGWLRDELGETSDRVEFLNMAEVGRNPGRIISLWRRFADEQSASGRCAHGIGEPVWPGRSAIELVECDHHESLLNRAFADASAFRLLCPYDTGALDSQILAAARRNHPSVTEYGVDRDSPAYLDPLQAPSSLEAELPEPAAEPEELGFGDRQLGEVRRMVQARAEAAGVDDRRRFNLTVAVNELACNSVEHGGGQGTLRIWSEPGALICEIADEGRLADPLVGRERPGFEQVSGRGVWLAHELCDLVQVRSFETGTVVRLHVDLGLRRLAGAR